MKMLFLVVCLMFNNFNSDPNMLADQNPNPEYTFIYVYDPLCGWCYGFSDVMMRLAGEYGEKANFEVVAGGMVRGDRVGPLSEIAGYLQGAIPTVENTTGVKFGPAFMADLHGEGLTIMDSEPACLMHTAVKMLRPELALPFAAAVQKAIYRDGLQPTDKEGLQTIALGLGVNIDDLTALLSTDDLYQAMINEFNRSEGLGVTGFPTLFLEIGGERYVLSRGYTRFENIRDQVEKVVGPR